uniref:Si:ch211-284e13.14 n=1 Tax=Danio rerio TaxID=7955 RepID=A0A8M9Q1N6_DANRE|nr:E3 ubiquitin-protein ligase ARIH2-like [Danio rerio]XP_021332232.1 E3 ubiquitin-protein ligase ARIH2-like [Danio rerio]|eukprot:XP_021327315.1 E3 ubiquitin-protein ligase ARIH2-like [Danio rerio]
MRTTRRTKKNTKKEEPQRETVIQWCPGGTTTMGAGNSQVNNNPTTVLSQDGKSLMVPSLMIRTLLVPHNPVNTSASPNDGQNPDPARTCPVCLSALNPARMNGQSNDELLQCPRCSILCGSCLYPCTSAVCTNKLCALVSTLLTCDVVTDPTSRVFGCPIFRACPKCYSLIMHEGHGCKHVRCKSCHHRFCFICLQGDCSKDKALYWTLTCAKQRAKRQRFMSTES